MDRGTIELVDHALGRLLVGRGLLGPDVLEAALRLAAGQQRLEAVLLIHGWVEPSVLLSLRSEVVALVCPACRAPREVVLAALEAGPARCPCGGTLVLPEATGRSRSGSGTAFSGSGSGTGRLGRPFPQGATAPTAITPGTGSGTTRFLAGPPQDPAQAGSGTGRLVAPAGSGTARWAAGGAPGAPGLPPGIGGQCGPYQLLDELGSGGYGVVFRGWDPRQEREVAIKLLTSTSPRARQRFEREIQATARLRHANIVPLLDSGEHAGTLYLVMELIRGRTLADRSEGADRLPLEASVRVMRDVARAIEYAHREGVLHRDIKPHNVLVDPEGRPHVVDFGLAQLEERQSQLTRTGAAIGTPAYMPPEQARSDGGADARSDVYALGATLYHALTGRPPFAGESGPEMLLAIFRQEPDPPSRQDRRVPVDLDTVCLKCLEKSPAGRYASAGALAEDLERWLRGEPIQARPVSTLRRTARRARGWLARHRRRALSLFAVGLALLLLGGLAVVELGRRWGNPATAPVTGELPPDPLQLAEQEAQARARSAERVDRCRELLQGAEERPLETEVEQVLHEVAREPDPAVGALLAERLEGIAGELWGVEREMLLEAAVPDADEAVAGVQPLQGLEEALTARERAPAGPLPPDVARVIGEAEDRLKRRIYRGLNPEARRSPPRLLDLVGSRQEGRLGQGRLMVARICCEGLARLGAGPQGIAALGQYLLREGDPLRALYAARAMGMLDDPAVEPPLRAALARFGEEGLLAEQIKRALERRRGR